MRCEKTSSGTILPDATSGTSASQVDGIDASVERNVSRLNKMSGWGTGSAMFKLTPMMETVAPAPRT